MDNLHPVSVHRIMDNELAIVIIADSAVHGYTFYSYHVLVQVLLTCLPALPPVHLPVAAGTTPLYLFGTAPFVTSIARILHLAHLYSRYSCYPPPDGKTIT